MEKEIDKKLIRRWRPRLIPRRKHKIRSLIGNMKNESENIHKSAKSCCSYTIYTFIFIGIFSASTYYLINNQHLSLINQLFHLYNEYYAQYQMLRHGTQNYCNKNLYDPQILLQSFTTTVLNQQDAIKQLNDLLVKHKNQTSITLIGGTGVGKTLTSNLLKLNWQWPDNVYTFYWSKFKTQIEQFIQIFNQIDRFSSKCGQYLIVIDDLSVDDEHIIISMNNDIINYATKNDINIISIYIVNLSAYLSDDKVKLIYRAEELNEKFIANKIPVIKYKTFNANDVRQCVLNEIEKLSIAAASHFDNDKIDEIMMTIDYEQSGCKHVSNKIAIFL